MLDFCVEIVKYYSRTDDVEHNVDSIGHKWQVWIGSMGIFGYEFNWTGSDCEFHFILSIVREAYVM